MEVWLDGFMRDSHPSREIAVWERIATVYLEYCKMSGPLTREQHMKVFALALTLSFTHDESELKNAAHGLPEDAMNKIILLHGHPVPIYDIKDDSLPHDSEGRPVAASTEGSDEDREHLSNDPPEDLVRALMKQGKPSKNKRRR